MDFFQVFFLQACNSAPRLNWTSSQMHYTIMTPWSDSKVKISKFKMTLYIKAQS